MSCAEIEGAMATWMSHRAYREPAHACIRLELTISHRIDTHNIVTGINYQSIRFHSQSFKVTRLFSAMECATRQEGRSLSVLRVVDRSR